MNQLCERHFSDFSLYFLGYPEEEGEIDPSSEKAMQKVRRLRRPILELTHNHGTEDDPEFSYHNGNSDPRGFGHVGFLCDNLKEAEAFLDEEGACGWQKRPEEGSMKGIAFAKDSDGYWVELIERGVTFPQGLEK